MTINEYLLMFNEKVHEGYEGNKIRPRVKCRDGYTVSVQAGYGMYSIPARFSCHFTHVELGYPSEEDKELLPYAEDEECLTGTVYVCVPVELVDYIMNKHGGIEGPDFSNCSDKNWKE